jgi:homogentisate 1,2-dioxygenase
LIFIHKGKGNYAPCWGIFLEYGDYLIIPRGIIYQIQFDTEDNRLFYVESFAPFTPQNAIKRVGTTFRALSFCERDFILPSELETHDEKVTFNQNQKKEGCTR